jgi:hypothetical protein
MTLSRQNPRQQGTERVVNTNDPGGLRSHDLRIKSAVPTIDSSGGQRALEALCSASSGATPTYSDATKRSYPARSPSSPRPLRLGGGSLRVLGR